METIHLNSVQGRQGGRSLRAPLALAALGLAASFLWQPAAQACGGFFCNRPQGPFAPLPVAQTGENVLFAMDRTPGGAFRLEAHVQIFYTGPADRFSWVVPVDSQPELDVGTNQMFTQLLPITQPRFGVTWKEEGTCRVTPYPGSSGAGGSTGAFDGSASGAGGAGGSANVQFGVQVAFRGDVGPYDAAVIKSTNPNDPAPLKDWLNQNKYFISDEGGKLIDDYVREDKYFVAIRLLSSSMVSEIQPLVMRFEGPGPCIPIRLTSIASVSDLSVNLWVLGDNRVVPDNFYEIRINPARISWFQNGANYQDLVKKAADEAGGNAFVVDYVGPPSVVKGRIYGGQFNIGAIAAATTPPQAVQQVVTQGIPRDAALMAILRTHIPEPDVLKTMGISETAFYNDLAGQGFNGGMYWTRFQRDFAPFDSRALAADIDLKIVKPLQSAEALFGRYKKLTRLSTYLSPEEMNVDPVFVQNTTLPDVPAQRMATGVRMCGAQYYSRCDAPVRLELPDGQKLYFTPKVTSTTCYPGQAWLGAPGTFDRATLDALPTLEIAYQRVPLGEGVIARTNVKVIDDAIAVHNKRNSPPVIIGVPTRMSTMPVRGSDPTMPGGNPPGGSAMSDGFGCAIAGAGAGPGTGADGGAAGGLAALALALGGLGIAIARRRARRGRRG